MCLHNINTYYFIVKVQFCVRPVRALAEVLAKIGRKSRHLAERAQSPRGREYVSRALLGNRCLFVHTLASNFYNFILRIICYSMCLKSKGFPLQSSGQQVSGSITESLPDRCCKNIKIMHDIDHYKLPMSQIMSTSRENLQEGARNPYTKIGHIYVCDTYRYKEWVTSSRVILS